MNYGEVHAEGLTPELEVCRHSSAHIMAQAVRRLFPGTKITIGPAIDTGFFYDFDTDHAFTQEDLVKIEAEMRRIIKDNFEFVREEISRGEAIEIFEKMNENYKVEILREIDEPTVSIYKQGEYLDLCRGPHLKKTGDLKAFKLLSVAGAYWRGSEKNKMLQRIYGTAFSTQKELDEYIHLIEESKARDHRKLGRAPGRAKKPDGASKADRQAEPNLPALEAGDTLLD